MVVTCNGIRMTLNSLLLQQQQVDSQVNDVVPRSLLHRNDMMVCNHKYITDGVRKDYTKCR